MDICKVAVDAVLDAPEYPALIAEYARECAIEGLPLPQAKLESYRALELTGVIHVFTAMHSGELVGFITVAAPPSLHFSVPLAVVESFYVSPEHRGLTGLRLLDTAECQAKACGAPGLLVSAPLGGRLCELLLKPTMRYRPTSVIFYKDFANVH